MATVDNRSITTNMEEIFLLQSMDGGGSGSGGGFNGKYLAIEAALNQQFGEPSISMGTKSYAAKYGSIVVGTDSKSGEYNTITFGNNNVNTSYESLVLGNSNEIHMTYPARPEIAGLIVGGHNNKLYPILYDSNYNRITIEGVVPVYYFEGSFYESLDYVNPTTPENNKIYVDLLSDTDNRYLYYNDELFSFQALKNLGWIIPDTSILGIISGENNVYRIGSNNDWACVYSFGDANKIINEFNDNLHFIAGQDNEISVVTNKDKNHNIPDSESTLVAFGSRNKIDLQVNSKAGSQLYLLGYNNEFSNENITSKFDSTDVNFICGEGNKLLIRDQYNDKNNITVENNIIFGRGNKLEFSNYNYIYGLNGYSNIVLGENNKIFGRDAHSGTNTNRNIIIGQDNKIGGNEYDVEERKCDSLHQNYIFGNDIELSTTGDLKDNVYLGKSHGLTYNPSVINNVIGGNQVFFKGSK